MSNGIGPYQQQYITYQRVLKFNPTDPDTCTRIVLFEKIQRKFDINFLDMFDSFAKINASDFIININVVKPSFAISTIINLDNVVYEQNIF